MFPNECRILVVDDMAAMRLRVTNQLTTIGFKQIEQAALTDVKLLLVGLARLAGGEFVLRQKLDLGLQANRVVVGDLAGLPDIAASFVAQIKGAA